MKKQCSNCEFNEDGICVGNSSIYHRGKAITDETKFCNDWEISEKYYTEQVSSAPRFLREAYKDYKIDYEDFSKRCDDFKSGKAVKINIFDAIKHIYGISMVDIAVLLGVTYGVVYRARSQGFVKKRISQFANGLCIPERILLNTTTDDFEELEKCKKEFFEKPNINTILESMPEWKMKLAQKISSDCVHCPMHLAKIIARVDNFYWEKSISIDQYTESEKVFINYMSKGTKKSKPEHYLKYSLDIANHPNLDTHRMK